MRRRLDAPEGVSVYFVGFGIFALVAILCVVAYGGYRKQQRRYEETGSLDPED